MPSKFFDEVATAFRREQDRWGLRYTEGLKPFEVFRMAGEVMADGVSDLYAYEDPDEWREAFRQMRDRSAGRAVVLLVLDRAAL